MRRRKCRRWQEERQEGRITGGREGGSQSVRGGAGRVSGPGSGATPTQPLLGITLHILQAAAINVGKEGRRGTGALWASRHRGQRGGATGDRKEAEHRQESRCYKAAAGGAGRTEERGQIRLPPPRPSLRWRILAGLMSWTPRVTRLLLLFPPPPPPPQHHNTTTATTNTAALPLSPRPLHCNLFIHYDFFFLIYKLILLHITQCYTCNAPYFAYSGVVTRLRK